jgi:histidinol-phosphatase
MPVRIITAVVLGLFACLIAILLHRTWINAFLPIGFIVSVLFLLCCGIVMRTYFGRIPTYAFALACSLAAYYLATISNGTILIVGMTIPGEKPWAGRLGTVLIVSSFLLPFIATLLPSKFFAERLSMPVWRTKDSEIDFMLSLVNITDQLLEEAFLNPNFTKNAATMKEDGTPVTKLDQKVEQFIRKHISKRYPEDEILGEEFGNKIGSEVVGKTRDKMDKKSGDGGHDIEANSDASVKEVSRRWIIDPIDGTKNFIRKVPIFATLIALEETSFNADGTSTTRIVKSVVSAPMLQTRWWGDVSAKPNVRPNAWVQYAGKAPVALSTSNVTSVKEANISISSRGSWGQKGEAYLKWFDKITSSAKRVRGFGDFYSYMLLAGGSVDLAFEPDLELYDIAALVPIVEGAGGIFTDIEGNAWNTKDGLHSSLVFANKTIRKEVNDEFTTSPA